MEHKKHKMNQEAMYYVTLFFLLLFTAGVSFMLLPLLYFAGNLLAVIITGILGLAFGLFLAFFIKELDLITHHHHAGIWAVFLLGSIINFGIIYYSRQSLSKELPLMTNTADPLVVALVFALCFFIPSFMMARHHAAKHKAQQVQHNKR